jgi:ribosomal protein S3AE
MERRDRRRKLLTPYPEKSGLSSKPLHLSSPNLLATPAQTEPRVLVSFPFILEKVEDSIKGRVVSQMQADLAPNQDTFHWRKIKLIVDQTEGRQAITSFYGVDTTRDELCSLIKKRKTLIEAISDVKSQDGYVLRIFVIAFTRESHNQKSKTNYALGSQQKIIRRKINEIIAKEVSKANATQVLNLFTSEVVEKKITKEISPIYPVKNVKIRKIKVIQRPNVDFNKLSEMHDPEKRILTKATAKVQGKRGKPVREQNVEAENLVHKD